MDVIPVSQSEINIRSILAIYTHKEKFSRSLRSSRGLPHLDLGMEPNHFEKNIQMFVGTVLEGIKRV